eukprot:IDg15313t1
MDALALFALYALASSDAVIRLSNGPPALSTSAVPLRFGSALSRLPKPSSQARMTGPMRSHTSQRAPRARRAASAELSERRRYWRQCQLRRQQITDTVGALPPLEVRARVEHRAVDAHALLARFKGHSARALHPLETALGAEDLYMGTLADAAVAFDSAGRHVAQAEVLAAAPERWRLRQRLRTACRVRCWCRDGGIRASRQSGEVQVIDWLSWPARSQINEMRHHDTGSRWGCIPVSDQ